MLLFGSKTPPHREDTRAYIPLSEGNEKSVEELELSIQLLRRELRSVKNDRRLLGASICLLVLVLCLLLFLLFANSTKNLRYVTEIPGKELLLTPVPPLPLTTVTFEQDERYSTKPSPESNRAWNALLPPGRGFVYIEDGEQYKLPPGQHTPWGEIYSVALFHQMHCLGELRKHYWLLLDGMTSKDAAIAEKASKLLGPAGAHVHHCFDYLRQTIMCAGDMSMEWPRTEPDGRRIAVDGWGIPHTCKSWDAISNYMEEKHFNHSTNSDIAP